MCSNCSQVEEKSTYGTNTRTSRMIGIAKSVLLRNARFQTQDSDERLDFCCLKPVCTGRALFPEGARVCIGTCACKRKEAAETYGALRIAGSRYWKPPQASILPSIFGSTTALRSGEVLGTCVLTALIRAGLIHLQLKNLIHL
jgi:hypothetical protein